MKQASSKVIPNVFVQQACLGSHHNAKSLWVRRMDALNGFAPYEAWDHPELLLTKAQREANPALGPLTLATTRAFIVRAVKPQARQRNTITPLHVGTIGDLPFVRDEDPAPAPVPRRAASIPWETPGTFNRLPIRIGAVNGNSHRSGILASRRRGHRSRPRSSAFRSRS